MEMKGIILSILAFTVVTASVMVETSEPAEGFHEIEMNYSKAVDVPYLDFDLEHLAIVHSYQQTHENAVESTETPEPEEIPTEPETEPEWTYYGNCRITHYDDCADCCGVAGNATASGVYPTPQHTVATGEDLPFGTELLINGQVYVVEDRGVEPGQVDIFVSDHETAVQMGMYYTDVYMRFPEQGGDTN